MEVGARAVQLSQPICGRIERVRAHELYQANYSTCGSACMRAFECLWHLKPLRERLRSSFLSKLE